MPLLKDGLPTEDSWRLAESEEDLDQGGPLFVTPEVWQSARARLAGRNAPLGLRLRSDQSPEDLAEDLPHFDLVALEFPKFKDGRAYSYARLLRQRHGFAGELRAVGEVLRDQLLFMQRCGFDAFEVADGVTLDAWRQALGEITVQYQPAADRRPWVSALRHKRGPADGGAASPKAVRTTPERQPCAAHCAY